MAKVAPLGRPRGARREPTGQVDTDEEQGQDMVDTALQRTNMVESQVRPSDVTDRRVIRAMLAVPREQFLPEALKPVAYMDGELALGGGRAVLAPRTFARLVQLANLVDGASVLDVGAGAGYSSAVLARMGARVTALESDAGLAEAARRNLAAAKVEGVAVVSGALPAGSADHGPYDGIVIEGAVEEVPGALLDQLKDGGRLVAILMNGSAGRAVAWQRSGGGFERLEGFDASAAPVAGFQKPAVFAL